MRDLLPDEKVSTVFVYTPTMLVRGDVILRENIRHALPLDFGLVYTPHTLT